MTDSAPTQPSRRCGHHWFEAAVASCHDCDMGLCVHCAVPVRKLGTFCRDCAMVRAGVRTRRRGSPAPTIG